MRPPDLQTKFAPVFGVSTALTLTAVYWKHATAHTYLAHFLMLMEFCDSTFTAPDQPNDRELHDTLSKIHRLKEETETMSKAEFETLIKPAVVIWKAELLQAYTASGVKRDTFDAGIAAGGGRVVLEPEKAGGASGSGSGKKRKAPTNTTTS